MHPYHFLLPPQVGKSRSGADVREEPAFKMNVFVFVRFLFSSCISGRMCFHVLYMCVHIHPCFGYLHAVVGVFIVKDEAFLYLLVVSLQLVNVSLVVDDHLVRNTKLTIITSFTLV